MDKYAKEALPCVLRDELICKTLGRKFGLLPKYFCRSCGDWTILPERHNDNQHDGEFTIHHGCPPRR
jgi:hypothetical protein